MALVYDRKAKVAREEEQYGAALLAWGYNTRFGRLVLWVMIRSWVAHIYAWYNRLPFSRRRVRRYIERYGIDTSLYRVSSWASFAAFFEREYRQYPALPKEAVGACAEGVVTVHQVQEGVVLPVKQRTYRLADIVSDEIDVSVFDGGVALVYKLSMHDYHRFVFPHDGVIVHQAQLPGVLHTVSAFSDEVPVYSVNKRTVTVIDSPEVGRMMMIEVGAMLVGDIVQNNVSGQCVRGKEKGRFRLGGSTVVVVYQAGRVEIDADILVQNTSGVAVRVGVAEVLGRVLPVVD